MVTTDVRRLRTALSESDFPADKDTLVRDAQEAGADRDTMRALNSIPPVEYANLAEVEQSVPLGTGPSEAEAQEQHRQPGKSGMSERDEPIPSHPIAEELGENRKR
ncbi:DUF2795 domain-containing protein [Saccharopolyspora cebuensis]|uniref:DUF2795 domain-containing protein n=1 Tax=Saccharopolyspora cebuensis TaxID=418759 RepID=A0ABV4CR33_9PSEU